MAISDEDYKKNIQIEVQSKLTSMMAKFDELGNSTPVNNSGDDKTGVNKIYDNINSLLSCDTDCQKRKRADELRNTWKAAEKTNLSAPTDISDAEEKYYVFTKGEKGYAHMMLERNKRLAQQQKEVANKSHHELMGVLKALVEDYTSDTVTLMHMKQLLKIKLQENTKLTNEIDENVGTVQTNDRRVVYEDWAKDWLGTVGKGLFWLYVLLTIIYLWKSPFLSKGGYKTAKGWIVPLIFVVFPFIVTYISEFIFYIVNQISWFMRNKAPHNVYVNI